MRKAVFIRLALLAVSALAWLGCATTTFESSWRNPEAQPLRLGGRKVVAVFVSRDPLRRRLAEDALAREITARGAQGVAAYTFLSDREVRDRDLARAKAEELGFAGAVVMREVGSETHYTYAGSSIIWADPAYRRLWGGYWRWGWGLATEPGYLVVDRIVKVETLVYSLEQDQLVWAGLSHTINPGETNELIAELAVAVSKQMRRDGLLERG